MTATKPNPLSNLNPPKPQFAELRTDSPTGMNPAKYVYVEGIKIYVTLNNYNATASRLRNSLASRLNRKLTQVEEVAITGSVLTLAKLPDTDADWTPQNAAKHGGYETLKAYAAQIEKERRERMLGRRLSNDEAFEVYKAVDLAIGYGIVGEGRAPEPPTFKDSLERTIGIQDTKNPAYKVPIPGTGTDALSVAKTVGSAANVATGNIVPNTFKVLDMLGYVLIAVGIYKLVKE